MPPQTSLQRLTWPLRVALFRFVLAIATRTEWALFHLGNARAERGDRAAALPLWIKAASSERPRFAAVKNVAATMLEENRLVDAVPTLEHAAPKLSGREGAEIYALLGKANQKAQKLAGAIDAFEKSLELDASQEGLRLVAALLLEKAKEPARALAHYRQLRDPKLVAQAEPRIRVLEKLASS